MQLNSLASMVCFANAATYSASVHPRVHPRQRVIPLLRRCANKLGAHGTLVVSVHPGPIATDRYVAGGFVGLTPEPPSVIAEGVVDGLKSGEFHVFADGMAKQLGGAYQSFAENVILADSIS